MSQMTDEDRARLDIAMRFFETIRPTTEPQTLEEEEALVDHCFRLADKSLDMMKARQARYPH